MCGITGFWNLDGSPVSRGELERFTHQIAHRGPDGWDVYIDSDARLGLGHRRLAIIDVTDSGRQPMSYADGRYWIVFNGEIYNFVEIRAELEARGCSFKTDSDTEVVLAAYLTWGEACQLKFNGMWAFAIWDSRERRLFLSRDRFGVKPLIYFFNGKRFAFASEMKAFLALRGFEAEFEPQMVSFAVRFPHPVEGGEECLLKGLKRLLGGYCMTVTQTGEISIRRWWNTLDHLPEIPPSYEEQAARYRELFLDACRIRMRSDVPVGVSLSGGLDSSSVFSAMSYIRHSGDSTARLAADWQTAFIGTYPGKIIDERHYADEVVRHTGARAVYCEMSGDMYQESFEKILYHMEDLSDIHLGPWLVHKTQRERGVVVTIDGHGGDETLAGYAWNVLAAMQDALRNPPRLLDLFLTQHQMHLRGGFEPYLNALRKRGRNWFGGRVVSNLERWLSAPPAALQNPAAQEDAPRVSRGDRLFQSLYNDFHVMHLPMVLRNFDRLSMAHGVEVRSPFMDWRLVTFSFALPSDRKIGAGYSKRILRDALRGILPEAIRTRKKKLGFPNLDEAWNAPRGRRFIQDILSSSGFQSAPFWDGALVQADFQRALRREDKNAIRDGWKMAQAYWLMKMLRDVNLKFKTSGE